MAPKKAFPWAMMAKMVVGGGAIIVGGPAFIYWVSPTDEELFQKYNPDLQRKSLERRFEKQQEFDDFVMKLKDYSKSDKPIWVMQAEAEQRAKENKRADSIQIADEVRMQKEAIRKEAGLWTEPKK